MIENFKKYLQSNVPEIETIEVFDINDQIRAKQKEAGIEGMTHVLVCYFKIGNFVISIDDTKETTKGWKTTCTQLKKNYEKLLKKVLKDQLTK